MPKPLSFGKIEVGLTAGEEAGSAILREGVPFRILILGDFSGRANRGVEGRFLDRKPIRVDRDNFEKVMAKLSPTLRLPFLGENLTDLALTFKELDDFRPDTLYRRVNIFQKLRDLRKRLDKPSSFAAAAAELRRDLAVKAAAAAPPAPKQLEVPGEPANLLEQMLGGKIEPSSAPQRFPGGNWQAYLQQLVEPHLLPKLDQAEQADLLGLVDSMTSRQMRLILHDRDFQALEATWRALFFLLRRLDTDNGAQLHLLDLTKTELAIDLGATDELTETGMVR